MLGLEAMPLKFLVVSIILLIVVSTSLWQLNVFLEFNMARNFKEDIRRAGQHINFLGKGSISQAKISVPRGYEFFIDLDRELLVGNLSGEIYEVSLEHDIAKARAGGDVFSEGKVVFPEGVNVISVYFGELEELKEYMIVIGEAGRN